MIIVSSRRFGDKIVSVVEPDPGTGLLFAARVQPAATAKIERHNKSGQLREKIPCIRLVSIMSNCIRPHRSEHAGHP